MKSFITRSCIVNGLLLAFVPGCVLTGPVRNAVFPTAEPPTAARAALGSPLVVQAQATMPAGEKTPQQERPLDASNLLTEQDLVAQVVARNPTLEQMNAAWQAAMQRIPQATSWDDPMFAGVMAPASFNSSSVDPGYRLEISQKIYFPGKLRLKGQNASAEADASRSDFEDVRIQLIEAARLAFFEYYLTDRSLSVNAEGLKLLNEFRQNADSLYKTGKVPQQDVFQADVEIGRQKERKVTLERMQSVAKARINTLMHLPTSAPLPLPAQAVPASMKFPTLEILQNQAVQNRPDLRAIADRISAEEASLGLARRDYYPDVELSGAYDSIMGNGPMRSVAPQVGVKINLPVRLKKRDAAVNEALFKIAQKRAELASRTDQINFQVQEAYDQFQESEKILKLYVKEILPSAQANIKAAQAAYQTGKVPFLSLVEAQRNFVNLKDRYYEATADFFRRRANLDRAIGGSTVTAGDFRNSAKE